MNDTIKTIEKLKTIHGNFSQKEIENKDLKTILNASIRAANASGRQSYSIIVVEDKEMMYKLCGYRGSKLLLYLVDYNRLIKTATFLGHEFSVDNITNFITGSTDTILAAQTAVIAAKSLGIDNLLTNGIHRGDAERVYKLLDIPKENCFPLIALVLGYEKTKPAYQKGRIKEGVIHYGKYKSLTNEKIQKIILDYDDSNKHLALIDNWNNEFDHYYDWFFSKWSKMGDNTILEKLLKETKFLNKGEINE